MANLYGRMQGERGEVTRTAHHEIQSKLETWNGAIKTELDQNGTFRVYIGSKSSPSTLIAKGNVNGDESGPEPEGRFAETRDGELIVAWR